MSAVQQESGPRTGTKAGAKGHWEVDSTHITHPLPPISASVFTQDFAAGVRAGFAEAGVLLDGMEYQVIDGFLYSQPKPVGGPAGAPVPPRAVFQTMLRLHPAVRRRMRRAATVWERKPWTADVLAWDHRVKPAMIADARALQRERVEQLTDEALLDHLRRAEQHLRRAAWTHARFTASAAMPLGDLIAHVERWTGLDGATALAGIIPADRLAAARSELLGPAADAVRSEPSAARILSTEQDPMRSIQELRASAAGEPVAAWLDEVGDRLACGYDYGNPRLLEVPGLLVQQLRAAVEEAPASAPDRVDTVRSVVPPEHRRAFDELVVEARAVLHLRDERVLYCDSWANGLLRRGLLEAGARLAERGRVADPDHAIDAELAELAAGLNGSDAFDPRTLAARHAHRVSLTLDDVPAALGGPAAAPPPLDWLPEPVRRMHEATLAGMAAFFEDGNRPHEGARLRGIGVSPGVVEGIARVLDGPQDISRLRPGDVLVARSTSPAFNAALPTVAAIVTDRGGALSHAAIVAREYGLPGVVGTRDATKRVTDGARVRVDGAAGEVVLLP